MRWMDLESVIQSEVSQKKKKQIPYGNTYIWNLRKKKGHEERRGKTGIKTQSFKFILLGLYEILKPVNVNISLTFSLF